MIPTTTSDMDSSSKARRVSAMEKEAGVLRDWISGIQQQKASISEAGNNSVSVSKSNTVEITQSNPFNFFEDKPARVVPNPYYRRELPEEFKLEHGCPYDYYRDFGPTYSYSKTVLYSGCSDPNGKKAPSDTEAWFSLSYVDSSGAPTEAGFHARNNLQGYNWKAYVTSSESTLEMYNDTATTWLSMLIDNIESSIWGYGDGGFNYKTIANATEALNSMWGGGYYGAKIDNIESSIWGYDAGSTYNYKTIANATQALNSMWGGGYFAAKIDNIESSIWGYDAGSTYNYKTIANATEALNSMWGGGYFAAKIDNTESSIWGYDAGSDYNYKIAAEQAQAQFQMWLNSGGGYYSVKVDQTESSFFGEEVGGSGYKTATDSSGTKSELWDLGGAYYSALTDNKESSFYGDFSGNGFKAKADNTAGLVMGWDSSGGYWSATANSDGVFFCSNSGGDKSTLQPAQLWLNYSGAHTQMWGGGLYMVDSGDFVNIVPVAGKDAWFQPITYVNAGSTLETSYFLCTTPEPVVGPGGGCTAIVDCVRNSGEFPTWTDTNATYVDWATMASYPTWTETNQTYVDWTTLNGALSKIEVSARAEVIEALLKLSVEATCTDGKVTVTLKGLPSTSSNSPDWPTNLGPGLSA